MDILKVGKQTIHLEANALLELERSLDDKFVFAVEMIKNCTGRIIITGIGKSAIVAQKIVATFNSTGTQSIFMHAGDAVHGDLGMIDQNDIVICISKSGSTPELKVLIPILKSYGITIIAMTSSANSYLAEKSDALLLTPMKEEADPNKLAPTTSTTLQSSMGDALAVALLTLRGFTPDQFAKFHPGGALGKQLYLHVQDLSTKNEKPYVDKTSKIKEILLNMSKHRLGATVVVNENEEILGIITDGDIRRWYQNERDVDESFAQNIMTKSPKSIESSELAFTAFEIMRDNNISQLPVTQNGLYEGMIHINDLLREGFV